MMAWSFNGGKNAYRNVLKVTGNFLFQGHKTDTITFLDNTNRDKAENDTRILLINRESVNAAREAARKSGDSQVNVKAKDITFDSFRFALLPVILMVIFVLATPIFPIYRRLLPLLVGLLLVHGYIFFKIYIWVTKMSSNFAGSGDGWRSFIKFCHRMLITDSPMRWVIPLLIWLIVVIRLVDWKNLMPDFLNKLSQQQQE